LGSTLKFASCSQSQGSLSPRCFLQIKTKKILSIPNWLFFAMVGSIFCVFIEVLLNAAGALTWDFSGWSIRAPWLIFHIGYLPLFLVAFWVYGMPTVKKQIITVGSILGFDLVCLVVFAGILQWI
jgi:hypothetical protein